MKCNANIQCIEIHNVNKIRLEVRQLQFLFQLTATKCRIHLWRIPSIQSANLQIELKNVLIKMLKLIEIQKKKLYIDGRNLNF